VAKVDAVLKANIANINDLTIPSAFTGVLDTYTGAIGGYSVRRLLGGYTGACMRVRRDSDDTEQDIGFDSNGDLDTAAIATFVGSGNNGYVTKWYGQESSGGTGSGLDAAQTTNANQPQIYNGTAVITENGKPGIEFTSTQNMVFTSTDIYSFFIVSRPTTLNTGSTNFAVGLSTALKGVVVAGDSGSRQARAHTNTGILNITGIGVSTAQSLVDYVTTGTTGKLRYNGANEVTGSATQITVDQIGMADSANFRVLNGPLQEVVMWDTNQDSNRSGIASDINTYFSIYT